MNKIAVVRDPLYLRHSNGPGHPESPERLLAIDRMLQGFPRRELIEDIPARDARIEELAWVHDEAYIRRIERTQERAFTVLDPDTSATSDSYAAALRAAGGVMAAVEAVLAGRFGGAFALVRPPGHHAEADRAMGFCLFNNVAVAAMYALGRHGLQRVLIVDWDVHHGNGTMHSFYGSKRVLYFSTHQYPHYPGTGRIEELGRAEGLGFTINVPLPGGQGDGDYLAVFRRILQPVTREYGPELVLVSAGFDIHRDDPLAEMRVTGPGFGRLAAVLKEVAEDCCQGKIVFALEGGYDLQALAEGVASVLNALIGEEGETSGALEPAGHTTERIIEEVRSALKPYWKSVNSVGGVDR